MAMSMETIGSQTDRYIPEITPGVLGQVVSPWDVLLADRRAQLSHFALESAVGAEDVNSQVARQRVVGSTVLRAVELTSAELADEVERTLQEFFGAAPIQPTARTLGKQSPRDYDLAA